MQPPWRSPGGGYGLMRATSGAGTPASVVRVASGACRALAQAHRRSSDAPIRRVSATVCTREPSWSIQIVGTSTMRQPPSRAAASRSTSNSRSRDAQRGAGRVDDVAAQDLGAALRVGVGQAHEAPHGEREARARHLAGERPAGRGGPTPGAGARRSRRRRARPRRPGAGARCGGVAPSASTKATRSASDAAEASRRSPRPCRAWGRRTHSTRRSSSRCSATIRAVRSGSRRARRGSARRDRCRRRGRWRASCRCGASSLCAGITMSRRMAKSPAPQSGRRWSDGVRVPRYGAPRGTGRRGGTVAGSMAALRHQYQLLRTSNGNCDEAHSGPAARLATGAARRSTGATWRRSRRRRRPR